MPSIGVILLNFWKTFTNVSCRVFHEAENGDAVMLRTAMLGNFILEFQVTEYNYL